MHNRITFNWPSYCYKAKRYEKGVNATEFWPFLKTLVFETESHVIQIGLELIVVKDDPELLTLLFFLSSAGIIGMCQFAQFYEVLGILPRTSCILGKHSTIELYFQSVFK